MYGTKDAAQNWAEKYSQTLEGAGHKKGVASPCHFWNAESSVASTCDLCAAGRFQDEGGKASCEMCDPGQYAAEGQATCLQCAPGTVSSADYRACDGCPSGFVADGYGNPECASCGPDMIANEDETACALCSAGQYREGNSNVTHNVCKGCPSDFYSSGATRVGHAGSCLECGDGKITNADGLRIQCQDCGGGSICEDAL